MNAPDLTALTPEERYHTERQQEGMHLLDYASASAIVALGAAAFFFLARAYWTLHGGSVETFSFWATGDIRWLEVLFWALLTSIAWNTTQAAGALAEREFQTRDALLHIGRVLEQPLIALGLVFIFTNLGISFGDTTFSLSDVPVVFLVGITIAAVFFTQQALDALLSVAEWVKSRVGAALPPSQQPDGYSDDQQVPEEQPVAPS